MSMVIFNSYARHNQRVTGYTGTNSDRMGHDGIDICKLHVPSGYVKIAIENGHL